MPLFLRRLRRRPLPHWLATVGLAVLSGLVVARAGGAASAERARWGRATPAVVVVHEVAAGDPVRPSDLAVRSVPASLLPAGAAHRVPSSGIAAVDLHAGEVLLTDRLAGGRSVLAALLPRDARGIAVPNDSGLALSPGDRVDVLATFDGGDGDRPPTFPVARGAMVLRSGRSATTLAVTRKEAPRVAYAVAAARITLALAGA